MSILAFLDRAMAAGQVPIDIEADAIIRAYFKRHPDAALHVTKLAMALTAQPVPVVRQVTPAKARNWLAALVEKRGNLATR